MSEISSMDESITPEPMTLTVQQYDNPQFTLTIAQGGQPVNLANYASVQILLKSDAGQADGSATKLSTTTSGITITNAGLGQCAVVFPQFTNISAYTYWRCDLVDGSGNIFTVLYGVFGIEPN